MNLPSRQREHGRPAGTGPLLALSQKRSHTPILRLPSTPHPHPLQSGGELSGAEQAGLEEFPTALCRAGPRGMAEAGPPPVPGRAAPCEGDTEPTPGQHGWLNRVPAQGARQDLGDWVLWDSQ